MTKLIAITNAVNAQLTSDGRPTDDPTKVLGADLHYIEPTMDNYLQAVKGLLQTAGYTFNYPAAFVAEALTLNIAGLIGRINDQTV